MKKLNWKRVTSTVLAGAIMIASGATGFIPALAGTAYAAPNQKAHIKDFDTFAAQCEAMNQIDLEDVGDMPGRVVRTEVVIDKKADSKYQSVYFKKRGHSQGIPTPELEYFPAHCLVEGYVTPHVQFSMMLPPVDNWNERFMLAACDAWCGRVGPEMPVPGLNSGFATLTNNGGHYSRAPFDGIWAHQDMRAREYFAHKANHVTAQVGKAIAEAFYGEKPKYSYLAGFSKGGNAGLFAAQRYPTDFDGIISKAPVVHYNAKNAAGFTWTALAVHPDGKNPVIYSDKLPIINKAVLDACDAYDGLVNGVIDNPNICDFDPAVLLCKPGQSEADNECLNEAQVEAVAKQYQNPTTADGTVYFEYPMDRGSEFDWARANLPVRGSDEKTFSLTGAATGLRYMVTPDNPGPGYDWRTFDYLENLPAMNEMAKILDPDATDMTPFKEAGGKMIIVHGWADAMITANMTKDWFKEVRDEMGAEVVDDFAQLYLVPGMVHGSGGTGPYVFDAIHPLMNWVEKGIAPTQLMMEDEPGSTPLRRRPEFPFPAYSKYSGKGDPNKAESFIKVTD
ncbi:tannase/feruloyl esterase family alpha/beta hydrolase [Kordiimonas pumila]|uniref:Tannase/feruloyl esterase family alpha/beta hydrolase n=1 Tax=Kordiimonas pumila TaxID=2161677 RepID=A0ABV7D0W9_9PROT|nr:tannase/feruloyl esterase family alpha/beta hydrolase [Kordiimonas pumila]